LNTNYRFLFSLFLIVFSLNCSSKRDIQYDIVDTIEDGKMQFAGVRSSSYGIKPFPNPEKWHYAMDEMSKYCNSTTPSAIWIVGVLKDSNECYLQFPGDNKKYENVYFGDTDKHEEYLDYFDKQNIKVFLQVEPGSADVTNLIDLVLNRYKHHECVIGFGVDVEWYREIENRGWGVKVTDDLAKSWEAQVKSHNPNYRLFLKHWDRNWMPPTFRGDIIFVDDSQMLESFEKMLNEFVVYWADYFNPNPVFYQVGYLSDYKWWGKLNNPPKDIGMTIAQNIEQPCGFFWVDFTLRKIFEDELGVEDEKDN